MEDEERIAALEWLDRFAELMELESIGQLRLDLEEEDAAGVD